MRGTGTLAVLFATMAPQTVVSMMSLTPPVMAEDVIATLALPAGVTGLYTGLIYFFVLLTNLLSAPLMGWVGPLRLSFACIVVAGLGLVLFGSGSMAGVLLATIIIGLGSGFRIQVNAFWHRGLSACRRCSTLPFSGAA